MVGSIRVWLTALELEHLTPVYEENQIGLLEKRTLASPASAIGGIAGVTGGHISLLLVAKTRHSLWP